MCMLILVCAACRAPRLLNIVSTRYGLQHIVPVMNVADAKTTLKVRAS